MISRDPQVQYRMTKKLGTLVNELAGGLAEEHKREEAIPQASTVDERGKVVRQQPYVDDPLDPAQPMPKLSQRAKAIFEKERNT